MRNNLLRNIIVLPIIIIISTLIIGCTNTNETPTVVKKEGFTIFTDVYTDKSRYAPGEMVEVNVSLYNNTENQQTGNIDVSLKYLNQMILKLDNKTLTIEKGERKNVKMSFEAPGPDFKGYLLDAKFLQDEQEIDQFTSAVDVSSDWSKFPRYGYLASYGNKPKSVIESIMTNLSKYHINGFQFYDWQYKHHMPVPLDENGNVLEKWLELSNRDVYASTVQGYIDAAHERNMMAMNYNLLFGTYDQPEVDGVDLKWGMYTDQNGTNLDFHGLPGNWQSSKLLLMNPLNQEWQDYIFNQEGIAHDKFSFDGWHVDQLGYRGDRYDYNGYPINLEEGYVDLLNDAKENLDTRLVFNAVDGYAQDRIAQNVPVDFLYQELWSPTKYSEIKRVIDNGFNKTNNEKSMILAAYMNYGSREKTGLFNIHSVLLTNATVFASGGAHLELGDTGMLSSEYFPSDNLRMSLDLKEQLRNYYDFLVAYQNFLRDDVYNIGSRIEIEGVKSSIFDMDNVIWYFTKKKDNYEMLHLINLLGNENDWRDDDQSKKAPQILENKEVKYYIEDDVKNVMLASPDLKENLPINLQFKKEVDDKGKAYVSFVLPKLEYWDMVIIEK